MTVSRRREVWLLLLVFLILGVGHFVVWQAYLPAWRTLYHGEDWRLFLPPALIAVGWLVISRALAARRSRETLILPVTALLVGLGLLFLLRLAGGATVQEIYRAHQPFGPYLFALYQKQLVWFGIGWAVLLGMTLFWKDYRTLARYKYVLAVLAVGLLIATTLVGDAKNGQVISLDLGIFSFQPHDPVKLLLVIFMAAYLVEKRELLSLAAGRYGILTLMDFRYLGPLVALWLLVMGIIFRHNDLGAALLLFGAFLGILYLGTERKSYLAFGLVLALLGGFAAYQHSATVQKRVAIWQNPWQDPWDRGFQISQSLMALGNGRVIGAGLGGGYSEQIPEVQTDMIYAGISEDLGLVGAAMVVALFLILIGRMYHIALDTNDRFGKLLAAGLATTLAVQAWVILAGTVKLIPLTGITVPFISYGGTSLVVNLILVGVALKVAEEPARG